MQSQKNNESVNPDSGQKTFGLLVPADLQCLVNVRRMISDITRSMGFNQHDIGRIEVAVDEACTNAIEHAYSDFDEKPPIQLEARIEEGRLVVDVIDSGRGFDFDRGSIPKFPDHWFRGHVRGAGLYLISECMDEVEYEKLPDRRNRMRLIKYRQKG